MVANAVPEGRLGNCTNGSELIVRARIFALFISPLHTPTPPRRPLILGRTAPAPRSVSPSTAPPFPPAAVVPFHKSCGPPPSRCKSAPYPTQLDRKDSPACPDPAAPSPARSSPATTPRQSTASTSPPICKGPCWRARSPAAPARPCSPTSVASGSAASPRWQKTGTHRGASNRSPATPPAHRFPPAAVAAVSSSHASPPCPDRPSPTRASHGRRSSAPAPASPLTTRKSTPSAPVPSVKSGSRPQTNTRPPPSNIFPKTPATGQGTPTRTPPRIPAASALAAPSDKDNTETKNPPPGAASRHPAAF